MAKYATPIGIGLWDGEAGRIDEAIRKPSKIRKPAAARGRTARRDEKPRVAILMGAASDWNTMKPAADVLQQLGVTSDVRVIFAHRTPARHQAYVTKAEANGIDVIIAGAGRAAHLAGVTAALTLLPVLGVPIDSSPLQGLDALRSTVQMPGGHSGRHARDRQAGCEDRRAARGGDPRAQGSNGARCPARFGERQTASLPGRL